MKIKPMNKQILVRIIEDDSYLSPSGLLYIPQTGPKATNEAIVLDVNPTCKNLSPGDHVALENYGGTNVKNPDTPKETLVLHNEDDIAFIILEE